MALIYPLYVDKPVFKIQIQKFSDQIKCQYRNARIRTNTRLVTWTLKGCHSVHKVVLLSNRLIIEHFE